MVAIGVLFGTMIREEGKSEDDVGMGEGAGDEMRSRSDEKESSKIKEQDESRGMDREVFGEGDADKSDCSDNADMSGGELEWWDCVGTSWGSCGLI